MVPRWSRDEAATRIVAAFKGRHCRTQFQLWGMFKRRFQFRNGLAAIAPWRVPEVEAFTYGNVTVDTLRVSRALQGRIDATVASLRRWGWALELPEVETPRDRARLVHWMRGHPAAFTPRAMRRANAEIRRHPIVVAALERFWTAALADDGGGGESGDERSTTKTKTTPGADESGASEHAGVRTEDNDRESVGKASYMRMSAALHAAIVPGAREGAGASVCRSAAELDWVRDAALGAPGGDTATLRLTRSVLLDEVFKLTREWVTELDSPEAHAQWLDDLLRAAAVAVGDGWRWKPPDEVTCILDCPPNTNASPPFTPMGHKSHATSSRPSMVSLNQEKLPKPQTPVATIQYVKRSTPARGMVLSSTQGVPVYVHHLQNKGRDEEGIGRRMAPKRGGGAGASATPGGDSHGGRGNKLPPIEAAKVGYRFRGGALVSKGTKGSKKAKDTSIARAGSSDRLKTALGSACTATWVPHTAPKGRLCNPRKPATDSSLSSPAEGGSGSTTSVGGISSGISDAERMLPATAAAPASHRHPQFKEPKGAWYQRTGVLGAVRLDPGVRTGKRKGWKSTRTGPVILPRLRNGGAPSPRIDVAMDLAMDADENDMEPSATTLVIPAVGRLCSGGEGMEDWYGPMGGKPTPVPLDPREINKNALRSIQQFLSK